MMGTTMNIPIPGRASIMIASFVLTMSGCYTDTDDVDPNDVSKHTSALSSFCSSGVDNLCNIPELNRRCSTNDQWVQGWYDYQALCKSAGGVDYICSRPVDNLCNIPELQLNCQSNAQWVQGYYDYRDMCPAGGRLCGSQPTVTTMLLPTNVGTGGAHPADAMHNPNYNLTVRGYTNKGDAAAYQYIAGPTDYSAINLTNLWPNRARPSNPFTSSAQFTVNTPDGSVSPFWRPIASGLSFGNCQNVVLPSTGLPGSPSAPACNASQPKHEPRLINDPPPEQAIVLYAGATTLTLQFTLRDGPIGGAGSGYTMYLDHIEVNPAIITAYQEANRKGRSKLPALAPNTVLGRAKGTMLVIAIRDTNTWMDPRFKKDWWQDAWTAADGSFPCNG
jgi:hypothetical protein